MCVKTSVLIATNCKNPTIVNFNLDKVVLPVGSVSESKIIIVFPFSDVQLAGL